MKTETPEEAAKEYSKQFAVKDAPIQTSIERGRAEIHYLEGYKAGQASKPEQGMKEDSAMECLKELVRLKRLKDNVGSTLDYIESKPTAWANAFKIVDESPSTHPGSSLNWTTVKPEWSKECLLLTLSVHKGLWFYSSFLIRKVQSEDGWYWGLCTLNGEEIGCINELSADRYLVIQLPETK